MSEDCDATDGTPQFPVSGLGDGASSFVEAGARLGRYRVVRRIGAGGMGVVYEAVDDTLGRHIALKVLRSGAGGADLAERFTRESRVLAGLHHPGIAQVLDVGMESSGIFAVPYFAMELVHGPDLSTYVAKFKPDLRRRLTILIRICRAVQHAHERGVLHRDLKPANILVPGDGQAKIVDFGVAKVLLDGDPLHTTAGQILGTLQYMAPEQLTVGGRISEATDVYALGLIAYELLCGDLPYKVPGDVPAATRVICTRVPAPSPKSLTGVLGKAAQRVLGKALAKDPSDRYSTAAQLADELERLLDGRPVEARQRSLPIRLLQRVGVRLAPFTPVVAVGAALIGTTAGTHFSGPWQERQFGGAYERWVSSHLNHVPDRFDHVAIITLSDQSDPVSLASQLGIPDFDPATRQSMRPVFGKLLERLAHSSARVVAMDFDFPPADIPRIAQYDKGLVQGVDALAKAGIPFLCAAKLRPDDSPDLGPTIRPPEVQTYPALARAGRTDPWSAFLMLQQPDGDRRTCLPAATAGAYWLGDSRIFGDYQLNGEVVLKTNDGRERHTRATSAFRADASSPRGTRAGDEIVDLVLEMPPIDVFEKSSVDMATVVRADEAWLKQQFGGKIILIGDSRKGRDGPHVHATGQPYYGFQAVATAIEMILQDRPTRAMSMIHIPMTGILMDLDRMVSIGLGLSALAAWPLLGKRRGRRWLGWAGLAGASVLTVVGCLGAYQLWGVLLSPLVPVASLLGAFVCLAALRLIVPERVPGG